MNLGHCYFALAKVDEARTRYEQALAIELRALPATHVEIGNAFVSLALIDLNTAKWVDAIAKLDKARAIYVAALGEHHPTLAIVENNLGEAERGLEHYAAAATHYENAIAVSGSREQLGIATSLSNLGDVLVLQHRYADAKPKYDEALATFRKVFGETSEYLADPLVGLARIAIAANDTRTAIPLLERARVLREHATPDEQAEVRDLLAHVRGR
jgi:tetratricopeptide (TPR) repeat protein